MKPQKLSDQYKGHELEIKAYELLSGMHKYTKDTEAEPTDAQFQEIFLKFSAIEFRRLNLKDELFKLNESFSGMANKIFPVKALRHPIWAELEKVDATKCPSPTTANISDKKYADLIFYYVTNHTFISLKRASMTIKNHDSLESVSPFMEKACHDALKRNDIKFFMKVGDVLRKRQHSVKDYLVPVPKLRFFLIAHWVKEINGIPPLYSLSIDKLLEVCKKHLDMAGLTYDFVEKSRQRIGLLTFRTRQSSKGKGAGRRKREPLPSQYKMVPVKFNKSGGIDLGPNWSFVRPDSK